MQKGKTNYGAVLVLMAALLLAGCAPTSGIIQNGAATLGSTPIDVTIYPHESLGLKVTKNILSKKATVLAGPLPWLMFGEMGLGRIRWNGWAVDPDNGDEYFLQFMMVSLDKQSGKMIYAVIIDSDKKEISLKTKFIILGSMCGHGLNTSKKFFEIDKGRFTTEREYRSKIVLENGTTIGSTLSPTEDVLGDIIAHADKNKDWHFYDLQERGQILSPHGEESVAEIATINPGYKFTEKLIAKGNITISHPAYTMTSILTSILVAMNAPTEGWDYGSKLSDRYVLAGLVDYVGEIQSQLIRKLNNDLALKEGLK